MSIAIVGGGAGGIFAALGASARARERGQPVEVHLFERNPRLGIKIRISGGGKCNITHVGSVEDILNEGFPQKNEQRFLKPALYQYTTEDVLALLEARGVAWHARENGRVFPDSGRADDVLGAFEQELKKANVTTHLNTRVANIQCFENSWHIESSEQSYTADALILATGGTSYRKVGTTGDGLAFAETLGHTIVPIRAALAPIYLQDMPEQELVGIALRDIELKAIRGNTVLAQYSGDTLITHRGLSGPAALGISREAALQMEDGPIEMSANLLKRNAEEARLLLIELQQSRPQQQINTWLEALLPNRFAPYVLAQSEIPIDRKWHALTREARARFLESLTNYRFGRVSEIPIDRGEVTTGGVDLKEVDPKTLMSRLVPGLFFAGEMLDVAGEIGGYNLQAAYSTGWVAGQSAVMNA